MSNLLPQADTVSPRSILFIGGTGVISAAAAERAVALGHRLTILNRGRSAGRPVPDGAEVLHADIRDAAAVREVLQGREFDAVADFISYTPDQARAGLDMFRGRTGQYVFISSASAYQKPPTTLAYPGIDAAEEPVLAVLAGQDRLRGAAVRGLP